MRKGPAPQEPEPLERPRHVQEITYESDGLQLKAWFARPKVGNPAKLPAVVYLHGGFAFGAGDFADAKPFLDAGFAVLCPMLRGENGNPGDYQMFLGEVRDAKAAIQWLASREGIDSSRLYAFGHSASGVISALLALHDVPLRHSGSSGGLYGTELFDQMQPQVPFALDDPRERELRVLVGNIAAMKRQHHAFVGDADTLQALGAAEAELAGSKRLLKITRLSGDHLSSLPAAVAAYVQVIADNP